ncbi:hypothetical protein Y032_0893g2902, partial [Ancylostoma ceylanicum]
MGQRQIRIAIVYVSVLNAGGALRSIERADDAALREVLSKNSFDVNAKLNCGQYAEYSMWWTLLDVALNLRLVQCARTLQNFGAHENILMDSIEKRKDALDFALKHTYDQVLQLKLRGQDKENDRVYQAWSTHLHMLERMERALAIIQLPDPPDTVKVESHSSTSISIHIETKREHAEPVLKYLIEWSLFSDFSKIAGTYVEKDVKKSDIIISGLKSKTSLCFRVYAGGVFGYSSATIAQPSLVELSSWHDIDGEKEDWNEYVESMATISEEIDRHRQSPVWKRVFPNSDDNIKKKKSGLKEMFLASKRFSRNATKGLFLGSVLYTEGKVLFTIDDCIPLLLIDENVSTISNEDFLWLMKMSICWEHISSLAESLPDNFNSTSSLRFFHQTAFGVFYGCDFRKKLLDTVTAMHATLGVEDIGHLHHAPIRYGNCVFVITVRYVDTSRLIQGLTLRWLSFDKVLRKKADSASISAALVRESINIMNFFESSRIPLNRGLYLCYMKLHCSLNVIRIVVPENLPSMLPFVHIRENPHVTKEEWQWIKYVNINQDFVPTDNQKSLHSALSAATQTLLHDLDIDSDLVPGHRLYHAEIVQPNENISIILILPRAEDVCSAPTCAQAESESDVRCGCSSIPLTAFEMIHQLTYQPDFIATYCRLSIFLDHFIMVSQFEQRQCILENDAAVYKTQLQCLYEFQRRLDEIWTKSRWIYRIATDARDKQSRFSTNAIPLGRLLTPITPSTTDDHSDIGYHSDQSDTRLSVLRRTHPPWPSPRPHSLTEHPQQNYSFIDRLYHRQVFSTYLHEEVDGQESSSVTRPTRAEWCYTYEVISVFAAYDFGFPEGTCVRLSISANTTSKK